jgi:hypothetical protein
MTDPHTLQFTVTHTLSFPVLTSRILATDFNTVIIPVLLNCTRKVVSSQADFQISTELSVRVGVRATLRLAVYRQSVRLGDKPLETHDRRFFFQLNTCGHSPYVTSSLTRRWVFHLQMLLALASAVILRSESSGTFYCFTFERVFISPQEQGGPVIPPGTWYPFRRLLRLAGLRWRYSNPPPHEVALSYSGILVI